MTSTDKAVCGEYAEVRFGLVHLRTANSRALETHTIVIRSYGVRKVQQVSLDACSGAATGS
jgi:hypothetical protein